MLHRTVWDAPSASSKKPCLSMKVQLKADSLTVSRFERIAKKPASFPVVLGDFGCDVTCQACRESSLSRSVPSLLWSLG